MQQVFVVTDSSGIVSVHTFLGRAFNAIKRSISEPYIVSAAGRAHPPATIESVTKHWQLYESVTIVGLEDGAMASYEIKACILD